MSVRHNVRILQRRLEHLQGKYAEQLREELAGGRPVNGHLLAEVNALVWALPILDVAAVMEVEMHRELSRVGA